MWEISESPLTLLLLLFRSFPPSLRSMSLSSGPLATTFEVDICSKFEGKAIAPVPLFFYARRSMKWNWSKRGILCSDELTHEEKLCGYSWWELKAAYEAHNL